MSRKPKAPTTTILVEEELRKRYGDIDCFMDVPMLMRATRRNMNQVTAALFVHRQHRVADVIINADGHGWWYALPPELDTRCRRLEERTPEEKPRKPRKGSVKT